MVVLSWQLLLCLLSPRQGRPPYLRGGLLHSLVRVVEPAHTSQSDQADHGLQEPWTRGTTSKCCFLLQELREDKRNVGCLTWTKGDDRAGLPLDLDSKPTVHLLFARAGRSSGTGLRAATASIAGNWLCPTGPGARSPLRPLTPATSHWEHTSQEELLAKKAMFFYEMNNMKRHEIQMKLK